MFELELFLSAFAILFVIIDPPGCAPIFATLTQGTSRKHQKVMAYKSVFVASLNRYASERAAVTAYNAIGNQIVSAYGQVYIDYAVNRTPAQLDPKGLTEKLGKITQKETEAEADASEAQTNKKGLFANGQAAAVDLSKQVGVIEATTKASMVAINNCLKD